MNATPDIMQWVLALGWSLVHFLWQGLLIGVLYAAVCGLLGRERSHARYAAGLVALAAMALAPILTLAWLWPESAVPAGDGSVVLAPVVVTGAGALVEQASIWTDLLPFLVVCWLVGVILVSGRAVHQWRALNHIATRLAWHQADLDVMLERIAARFGRMPSVCIRISDRIDTPTLIGWIKPVILLPAAVVARFPRQQLELILAHELGHLRRYDHIVNLVQTVIETVLFYHPAVHWISREVRHEREICCDNLVLQRIEGKPCEYARTLAALESSRQLAPQFAVAASGGRLLDRVRRIVGVKVESETPRHAQRGGWLVLGLSLALVLMIGAMARDHAGDADEAFAAPLPSIPSTRIALASIEADPLPGALVRPVLKLEAKPVANLDADSVPTAVAQGPEQATEALAAALVPEPAQPRIETESIEVGDLAFASPAPRLDIGAFEPTLAADAQPEPRLMHMVAPEFHGTNVGSRRVGFRFGVDARGHVRDIVQIEGDMDGGFAKAARRALAQWRFDPDSLGSISQRSFRQDFQFEAMADVGIEVDADGCTARTGSHLCRKTRATGSVETRVIEPTEQRPVLAQQSELSRTTCDRPTGSNVCREIRLPGSAEASALAFGQVLSIDGRNSNLGGTP